MPCFSDISKKKLLLAIYNLLSSSKNHELDICGLSKTFIWRWILFGSFLEEKRIQPQKRNQESLNLSSPYLYLDLFLWPLAWVKTSIPNTGAIYEKWLGKMLNVVDRGSKLCACGVSGDHVFWSVLSHPLPYPLSGYIRLDVLIFPQRWRV